MVLVVPSLEYEDLFFRMVDDYRIHNEYRYQIGEMRDHDAFVLYVESLMLNGLINDISSDIVPQTTYWMISDGEIAGISRLRHRLTEHLLKEGGNIGYEVPPSQRCKGCATRLLALTLEKAKALGLERVLVTCDKDNVASRRVIEKNGGVYDGESVSDISGKDVLRFWIAL